MLTPKSVLNARNAVKTNNPFRSLKRTAPKCSISTIFPSVQDMLKFAPMQERKIQNPTYFLTAIHQYKIYNPSPGKIRFMSADIAALNSASNETITTVTLGNFPALHRNDISPASIQHCIIPSFIFGIVVFFFAPNI